MGPRLASEKKRNWFPKLVSPIWVKMSGRMYHWPCGWMSGEEINIGPCDRGFQLRRYFRISSSLGTQSKALPQVGSATSAPRISTQQVSPGKAQTGGMRRVRDDSR